MVRPTGRAGQQDHRLGQPVDPLDVQLVGVGDLASVGRAIQ